MKSEGQSIYKDSERLCDLLYECTLMMTKENRIVYLTSARTAAEDMLLAFVMAYEFRPEQWYYFQMLYALFNVVLARVRRIINKGRLTSPNPQTGKKPGTIEKEMADCLDRIETSLGKWRNTIIVKGHDVSRDRLMQMPG